MPVVTAVTYVEFGVEVEPGGVGSVPELRIIRRVRLHPRGVV
jgi:hypothetical protein